MLAALADIVDDATAAFDVYEHAKALDVIERFFWGFTDDYLELVKQRAYGASGPERAGSAVGALRIALDVLLRSVRPVPALCDRGGLVLVAREARCIGRRGRHPTRRVRSPGPIAILACTRWRPRCSARYARRRPCAKVTLKTPVDSVTVHDTQDRLRLLSRASADLREAGNIRAIEQEEADAFSVDTVLAEPDPPDAPRPAPRA